MGKLSNSRYVNDVFGSKNYDILDGIKLDNTDSMYNTKLSSYVLGFKSITLTKRLNNKNFEDIIRLASDYARDNNYIKTILDNGMSVKYTSCSMDEELEEIKFTRILDYNTNKVISYIAYFTFNIFAMSSNSISPVSTKYTTYVFDKIYSKLFHLFGIMRGRVHESMSLKELVLCGYADIYNDATTNNCDSQEFISKYLQLLSYGKKSKRYRIDECGYKDTANTTIIKSPTWSIQFKPAEDSISSFINKYTDISKDDIQNQSRITEFKSYSQNKILVEFSLTGDYIRKMHNVSHIMKDSSVFSVIISACEDSFIKHIISSFGPGDFYNYETAKTILDHSDCNRVMRDINTKFLRQVEFKIQHTDIMDIFNNHYKDRQYTNAYKNLANTLGRDGISPIVIPTNLGITKCHNIIQLMKNEYNNILYDEIIENKNNQCVYDMTE